MAPIHAATLVDRDPLVQILLKELKCGAITIKLETPKPPKRSLVPFSTPGSSSSNQQPQAGRIFGKRLTDLSKLLVNLDDNTDIFVPKFVVSATTYIEENVNTEGIYRLAGSNARQKNIRRELEIHEHEFANMNPLPSVLDVASLLKQFMRELPIPLIPTHFHAPLEQAHSKDESSLLLCLQLLPPEHLSLLSFLARHLATVASKSAYNKMNATNLAIVLTPSLFPIQDLNVSVPGKENKKLVQGDRKLKIHTAIVETLIHTAEKIGYLSGDIYDKYHNLASQPGYASEEFLDDECARSRRKGKKGRNRRRSGSLSRVLSVMGKGIRAIARSNTPSRANESIHSTPLPAFGSTPDYPSPRGNSKRKASADHELSPSMKSQKRGFESTFTPKMRTRTFSVKRFKRKKSGAKLVKESLVIHTGVSSPPGGQEEREVVSPLTYRSKPSTPPSTTVGGGPSSSRSSKCENMEVDGDKDRSQAEGEYDELKAQYEDLKVELRVFENNDTSGSIQGVQDRYEATLANGSLEQENRQTARQLARVKRRSSEAKKPRSPSERRIGVIRRRSREREERQQNGGRRDGPSPRERGRSPGPRRNVNRSPVTKELLTPCPDESGMRTRLQRGRPNSNSSGLERPSPVNVPVVGPGGRVRIKSSFRKDDRPLTAIKSIGPILANKSPKRFEGSSPRETRQATRGAVKSPGLSPHQRPASSRSFKQSDSLTSLRNDIVELIEKSFSNESGQRGSQGSQASSDLENLDNVFDVPDTAMESTTDVPDCTGNLSSADEKEDVFELSSKLADVTFKNPVGDFMTTQSPVTRGQLRRQSHSFEFTKPTSTSTDVRSGKHPECLRRQSSAFEFRSAVEPIYENLSRDVASRASLRRRNSSVKDLITRMEAEAKRRVGGGFNDQSLPANDEPIYAVPRISKSLVPSVEATPKQRTISESTAGSHSQMTTPNNAPEEMWVDGAEFFKNVLQVEQPQCGRSSIVKIRNENRGKVLDSISKFSGTPARRGGMTTTAVGSRRMSARMGVCASPNLLPPPVTRRQTLTGIKTSAGSRTSAHYTKPTIAAVNKKREKSPAAALNKKRSPNIRRQDVIEKHHEIVNRRKATERRPSTNGTLERRPSRNVDSGERKTVERKLSTNHTLEKRRSISDRKPTSTTLERRPSKNVDVDERSHGKDQRNRNNVRRTASNTLRRRENGGRGKARKRDERRFLTIGYNEDVRSPLKECQNIHANVKRSNSDQTQYTKKEPRQEQGAENTYQNIINVARTHSLKTDAVMSPALVRGGTPRIERVRRAMSDRTTPRTTPYVKIMYGGSERKRPAAAVGGSNFFNDEGTPRRSPRLQNFM